MKDLPIIKGNKIYLGPMPDTTEFYELYKSWLISERVMFGIGDDSNYSIEDVKAMLDEWRNDHNNNTFCVFDLELNQPIGDVCIRYGYEKHDNDGPEVAIMMGRNFGEGKGYEALLLLLTYAFSQLNYNQVNLSVYENNIAAVKLFEKLGFRKKNIVKDKINGRNEYIMKIQKKEWLSKLT